MKKYLLLILISRNICAAENENPLFNLRQEYDHSSYIQYESMTNECRVISAALNINEYPWLPLSHHWKRTDQGPVLLYKHKDSPTQAQIFTFGSAERHKLAYIVQEAEIQGSWRTMYSYAPTRSPVFSGERSQKPFKSGTLTYDAGHCIDHGDTPDEKLNFYNRASTDFGGNLLPEPPGGWGITIRSHLVTDIRKNNGAYAQFAYYDDCSRIDYTSKPWKAAIPKGVLFLEHGGEKSAIASGWKIDWNDTQIHYNSSGTGPRGRLRENLLKNIRGEQIFAGHRKQPQGLAYIYNHLDKNFTNRLELNIDNNSIDPLTRYKLEVLADGEMVPHYILQVIQSNFNEGRHDQGMYWTKRLLAQSQILLDNDLGSLLQDYSSLSSIIAQYTSNLDLKYVDHLNVISKESNHPSFALEPVTPKIIKIKTGKKDSPPDLKKESISGAPLIFQFEAEAKEIKSQHKSAITRYFGKFNFLNKEFINSPDSGIPYVHLMGTKELVSESLHKEMKEVFKNVIFYDFDETPFVSRRIDFAQEEIKMIGSTTLIEQASDQDLIDRRHDNPQSQQAYDKRFGLILLEYVK